MANEDQSRLINQAQFKRLGNDFRDYYVTRDLKYLSNAIDILQRKVNYINKNYVPKATDALKNKLGYSDSQYTEWLVHVFNNSSQKELRALADKNTALSQHPNSHEDDNDRTDTTGHPHERPNDAKRSDEHKEDHSHHHDNHPHANENHDHKGNRDSNSDLNFLNNMNK